MSKTPTEKNGIETTIANCRASRTAMLKALEILVSTLPEKFWPAPHFTIESARALIQFAKEPPADATVCCGAAKSISIDDGVTYCKKCFQPVAD